MKQILTDIYESYGLHQYISKPTRIDKASQKPTIIDHIWAAPENKLIKASGTFIGLSDHMGTYMKLNKCIPAEKNDKIIFRNYKKYDAEAFNKELAENIEISQIQEQIENGDVNQATATLMKTIQDTAQNHAPVVEATCRNNQSPGSVQS